MNMQIEFTVYGKPLGKGRPRFFRRGRFVGTYTDDRTQTREDSVLLQALEKKPAAPLTGPLEIELEFYFAIPKSVSRNKRVKMIAKPHDKKPDLDNLIKAVLDPLNTVYWEDDRQLTKITAIKMWDETPRTVVRIMQEK